MKRNYQRLKISALLFVPAKIFFVGVMLFLATPSPSSSQEMIFTNPVLMSGSDSLNHVSQFLEVPTASHALLQAQKRSANTVTIESVVVLPVKLTSFTAKGSNNGKVILDWHTSQEQNFSHFTIERSLDGREFSDAGIIFSMDDSEQTRAYSFTDKLKAGETGTIHYRLKMVDTDGKCQLSPTKIVTVGATETKR